MGSDTIFCRAVHLVSTDLDLKWLSVVADQSGMQGLIHVLLRHGNIIFETAWDRLIHLMDHTQGRITVFHAVNHNPDRKQVIDLL